MSELATVKSEIKTWERDFKAQNRREPQVQDIKENPSIAAKYKLYKQLSKASASSQPSSSKESAQPSRSMPKQRIPELKTGPLTTFNPFSPQKERHTRKPDASPRTGSNLPPNPFATPSKPKTKTRSFSPDLSPQPPSPIDYGISRPLFFNSKSTPNVLSAVSRARKRLRGEAVSPSPVKEKKRRMLSEEPPSSPSPEDEDDVFNDAGGSSFISDSPVKGSTFKLLFNDSTAKATSKQLFLPSISSSQSQFIDASTNNQRPRVPKEKPIFPSTNRQTRGTRTHLSSDNDVSRPSRKRSLSQSNSAPPEDVPTYRRLALVPPSPPEASSRPTGPFKGKGKAGNTNDRKKIKKLPVQSDGDGEDDGEGEGDNIKVVVRGLVPRSLRAEHSSDGDESDVFLMHTKRANADDPDTASVEEERLEVNLPDKLKQVLAFSPTDSKARGREGRVIEGLLYGRRTEHYDASRGGEIWDIGEEDANDVADDEEDWESEPVPWEIGEL